MAKKTQAKISADLKFLRSSAEHFGIETKGTSNYKILNRLKGRSSDEMGKIADYFERGYSLDMVDELFSRKWVSNKRQSGGKVGEFKTQSQEKIFENRFKREAIKEFEKTNKGPKLLKEEKKALMEKDFKSVKEILREDKAFDPQIRKDVWKQNVGDWEKGENKKFMDRVRKINMKMGIFPLTSENGVAVIHYMTMTGASEKQAMQDIIYDRIYALPAQYDIPTMIPKGIHVDSHTLQIINDERTSDRVGLPPLTM